MDTPSTIDQKTLEEFKQDNLEGSAEMYASILEIFLSDAPKMIEQISKAVSRQSFEDAKGPAHNLKSNSAALGAKELSRLAKLIEQAAIDNDADLVTDLSGQIQNEFSSLKPFFEKELSACKA